MRQAAHTCVRLLVGLAAFATAACGQKGPPLAPIVYLPRPVTELSARRVEQDVVIEFTLPTANTDNTSPADLRRVEVYAHTGPLPAPTDYVRYGTLVASVDVEEPAQPQPDGEKPATAETAATDQRREVQQGWKVAVRETLTDTLREPGPLPPSRTPAAIPADASKLAIATLETEGTVNFEAIPLRFYTAVGVSDSRGRRGPFVAPLPVPLVEPLLPPAALEATYSEKAIIIKWPGSPEDAPTVEDALAGASSTAAQPAASLPVRFETEGTDEPFSDVETEGTTFSVPAASTAKPVKPPQPRFGYRIYDWSEETAADVVGVPPGEQLPGTSINSVLLTTSSFSDSRIEFGTERCYTVRRVEMAGAAAIEGPASPPVCVTPVDKFPPGAPKELVSIPSAGGVSLLWQANTEPDLGGYLVLRGEAPGDTLSPLTPTPIADTTYTDTAAEPGRTYVYAVVAVDQSTPANVSEPSNRVEETIR